MTEEILVNKICEGDLQTYTKLSKSQRAGLERRFEEYAEYFLQDEYGLPLRAPIKICGRLTKTFGQFRSQRKAGHKLHKPIMIKMSERFVALASLDEQDGTESILDVLKHELVHYALCAKGQDYSDGSYEFESELARLGLPASGSTRIHRRLTKKKLITYHLLDVYKVDGEEQTYLHTKQARGERLGTNIVKVMY